MVFIETKAFTRLLGQYLDDESYNSLQAYLAERPDAGAVIRGSGGVRKVRWAPSGKGKSGGVRVIYYWLTADEQVLFLTLYGKNEKENLSNAEVKAMAKLIEELK
jgi:hypothetical protein